MAQSKAPSLSSDPLNQVTSKVLQQKKLVILVAALGAATILAVTLYQGRKTTVQTSGNGALYEAKAKLKDELTKAAEANTPAATPAPKAKAGEKALPPARPAPSLPDRFALSATIPTSLQALKTVGEKYESSFAGYEANLLLGQLYYQHDTSAEALSEATKYFKKAADQKIDSEKTSVALSQLSYALVTAGKKDEALAEIDKAVSLSGKSGIQADLLQQKARLLKEKGDSAKAVATLDELLKSYPNTEYGRWAEQRKAEWK